MPIDLRLYFEQFLDNISLGNPQVPRMNSAWETVRDFLASSYDIAPGQIFLQGSYANGTAIEPVEGGEYDIDMVAICATADQSADQALNDLEARFRADGRFQDRIKRKNPCVRLEYAGDNIGTFHVDVVPVRPTTTLSPPLESPRRGEGWRGTAPAEYTEWCQTQGEPYLRTVKMLKRWRSEHQGARTAIKSIVLQVLIAEYMTTTEDDGSRLSETLSAMHRALSGLESPPVVDNPVLASENLAAGWSNDSFRAFVAELDEAVRLAAEAVAATDTVESVDAWREIFGDDFPATDPSAYGISLGDYSHAQTPADRGWSDAPDPAYRVAIDATSQRGKKSRKRRPYVSNGPLLFTGHRIRFKANVVAPNHVEVWWQVANTGGHARDSQGLRGDIFKGRDLDQGPSNDETENWESTSYTGSHLVRALLVRDGRMVASSSWFTVNIYAKGHNFRF